MLGEKSAARVGRPTVVITNGGPHTPEAMAELCVGRLVHISAGAAPHLKMQAEAFREQLLSIVTVYMRHVAANEREIVALHLDRVSQHDLAARVRANNI